MSDRVTVWTIYNKGAVAGIVAVPHYVLTGSPDGLRFAAEQGTPVFGRSLEQLREEFQRRGLFCLGAGPLDEDSGIIESWI